MIVLHFQNSHSVFFDLLDYKPIVAGKSHRVLPGTIAFQRMKPQRPVPIELSEFLRSSEDSKPLNILPPDWKAEEPTSLRETNAGVGQAI